MTTQNTSLVFGSAGQKLEPKLIGTVIVYDTNTGRIAHTHQFVHLGKGEPPSKESMEKQALKAASPQSGDHRHLAVLHHGNMQLKLAQYRVDLKTQKLMEVARKK